MSKLLRLLLAVGIAATCLVAAKPAQATPSWKPVLWAEGSGTWTGQLTADAVLADGSPMHFDGVAATGSVYVRVDCLLWILCLGRYALTIDGSTTTPALSASGPVFLGSATYNWAVGLSLVTPAIVPSTVRFGNAPLDFGYLGSVGIITDAAVLNLSSSLGAIPARHCPTETTCQRIELRGDVRVEGFAGPTWNVNAM